MDNYLAPLETYAHEGQGGNTNTKLAKEGVSTSVEKRNDTNRDHGRGLTEPLQRILGKGIK